VDELIKSAYECMNAGFPQAKTLSVARRIRKIGNVQDYSSLKLAILATSNVDYLAPALEVACFSSKISLSTWNAGFNQIDQEVLNQASGLYAFQPHVAIIYARAEDIISKINYSLEDIDEKQLNIWIEEILQKFQGWAKLLAKAGIKSVFFSFARPVAAPLGIRDFGNPKGQQRIWERLNDGLINLQKSQPGVTIFDLDSLIRRVGFINWTDAKLWSLAKIAGGTKVVGDFVDELMPVIREVAGRKKKCLVLDLDNTLWGGIIGEDGINGVKLGGDYPGNIYLEFQKRILDLWKQGVILAINSKNNQEDAVEMIENHPEMILKIRHFAALRINWLDKSKNLESIVKELNIGIDSVVFVDDNPVECERIANEFPDVTVMQIPATIEMLSSVFQKTARLFDGTLVSQEDVHRNLMYQQNQLREKEQGEAQSIDDFLSSLEMKAEFENINDKNIQRVVQLLQKTNQFNLTTRRHTEQVISNMIRNDNWKTYVVRLKDKYGDNGIVMVALLHVEQNHAIIDTLLMSCRVIGRSLERVVLNTIKQDLRKQGLETIYGKFIPTSKNKLVENLFADLGFDYLGDDEEGLKYKLSINDDSATDPKSFISVSFVN